jgi:glycerol-3-phosphate dehydrogenase
LATQAYERDGHGMGPVVLGHLADRYGSRIYEVLGLVARERALGEPIVPGLPDARAEVIEAVEHEWAVTLEDVLRRRTQVALLDAAGGASVAGEVARLMAARLGWDAAAAQAAARDYAEAVLLGRRRWR